ncbi:heavy metal translocatin [Hortaea werneckii]|nr:heavy metal translocatin [Hortaea werneckii]KAI7151642.1 heavy metal translocatin [Hortaea werneckii]KAI7246265.1 heavy metal translocatin [Hortaea werneckii]KAI7300561.1 heavy metal translocatin [Hortaea werneckii]
MTTSQARSERVRVRRKGCNEDCLRRIAVRLCQLEAADRSHGDSLNGPGNVKVDDRYKPPTDVKDVCADACCKPTADVKDDCADACCKPTADVKDDCADACCKPPSEEKDDCADACCKPTADVKDDCADACCKPPSEDKDDCADACCKPTADVKDGCADTCCEPPSEDKDDYADACCKPTADVKDDCADACCKPTADVKDDCADPCCKPPSEEKDDCADACCKPTAGDKDDCADEKKLPKAAVVEVSREDAETAAAREQVVLNVAGMTCTGCSKKLMNVLDGISGILNPKVTFVSGTASFELGNYVEKKEVDAVLSLIEKQTGFKVSRIVSDYQHVDVLIEPSIAQQLERESMNGFVSVEKIYGKQYRITYNSMVVGVRDLLPPSAELAPPAPDPSLTEGKRRLVNMTVAFALSAVFTIPIVVLSWSHNPVPRQTREIVSLALASFVQGIAIPEFYIGAVKSLIFSRVIEMDMLVVISITAAYFYSVVAFALYEANISVKEAAFFETSSLLITLVLLGRLIAAAARVRAVSAVSLRSLQAETTQIVQPNGQIDDLDARLLQFGDTFQIPAHARIVTDGDIVSGSSAVDESMLTGESNPVPKQPGDSIIAGTMNGPGVLVVRLTRLPGANSITDIASLVENALGAKPRIQDLADKVASWFIPSVVLIALITFIIWLVVALKVRGENAGGAIGTAITYGIAVLAISCPCALGLAVPMVLVIAGGVAARAGVIIKEADAIERGYKTTDVVFDKTGTITNADLTVVHQSSSTVLNVTTDEALALASTLVDGNSHPVSLAISSHLKEHDRLESMPVDINSVPGAGIEARWNSFHVKAGNPYWTSTDTEPNVRGIIEGGMTAFCVTVDGSLILAFGLTSTIRDEAALVIEALQRKKIRCHVVSGDADKTVHNVASRVGIAAENVASRHSPAQKMEYVKRLQSDGCIVLFCGDGTNDAVAVAQADVGVQIGIASDVTNGVCDVTLLGGLEGVPMLLGISKRAFARITFNFVWTAVYNVFAILLASGAFVVFRIPPAYAGLGEIVSVCPVIAAAATLIWGSNSI